MNKLILLIAIISMISAQSWAKVGPLKSLRTSISKCKSVSVTQDNETLKCNSVKDYDVYIEVMDMYSGLLIQHKSSKYNVVEMINEIPAGKCTVGAFTFVSGKKIQWIYKKKNIVGLSVKVTGTDILSENNQEVSAHCVIKIDERKHSTVLGLADSPSKARELLNNNL